MLIITFDPFVARNAEVKKKETLKQGQTVHKSVELNHIKMCT